MIKLVEKYHIYFPVQTIHFKCDHVIGIHDIVASDINNGIKQAEYHRQQKHYGNIQNYPLSKLFGGKVKLKRFYPSFYSKI